LLREFETPASRRTGSLIGFSGYALSGVSSALASVTTHKVLDRGWITPWERIKRYLQPSDGIWLYGTSSRFWENLADRQGVVLVRNGRVVKEFLGIQT
jgi:hypothetical protein